MHVAIDLEHTRQSEAGVTRFTRGLSGGLRETGEISVSGIGGGPLVPRGGLQKRLLTLRQDLLWYPWYGRRTARRIGADVYHCPSPRAPLSHGTPPLVVTMHDMVPVHFPETMTRWSRLYGRATLSRVLDAADRITTPTRNTADDLLHFGVAAEKIRIVPNGVANIFFDPFTGESPRADPYILFVGTPEPRKNLPRLIAAVELLRARGRRERLVIAGGRGWGNVNLTSPLVDAVGRVGDEQLHALYSHASCLAIPSLHEGFGLPVIEAMAVGTPVVAGDRGALPEVAGGAAVLVDPLSADSIANGLLEAMARRDELVARGRERAATFTWRRAASAAISVYRELC